MREYVHSLTLGALLWRAAKLRRAPFPLMIKRKYDSKILKCFCVHPILLHQWRTFTNIHTHSLLRQTHYIAILSFHSLSHFVLQIRPSMLKPCCHSCNPCQFFLHIPLEHYDIQTSSYILVWDQDYCKGGFSSSPPYPTCTVFFKDSILRLIVLP